MRSDGMKPFCADDDQDTNVSGKVVKIVQSHMHNVNRALWLKGERNESTSAEYGVRNRQYGKDCR